MKVVSWQNVLTEHQSHTLRALQKRVDGNLQVVTGTSQLAERARQGWKPPDVHDLAVTELPVDGWWRRGRKILQANRAAVHLFNGLWSDRRFLVLIVYARLRGIRVGLVTEPWSEEIHGLLEEQRALSGRIRASLRPLMYRLTGWFLGGHVRPLFAISARAVRQFNGAGFRASQIFGFGYFVPAVSAGPVPVPRRFEPPLRLIFAGSLLATKGIDDAVEAMRHCHESGVDARLDIFGPGDAERVCSAMPENTRYLGVIEFGEVQRVVRDYDLLLLPSRHDGWGVVVNEALLQGIPVLASDAAGSSSLVAAQGCGAVFPAGDPSQLAELIASVAADPACLRAWRERALETAPAILPERAADYMVRCLQYSYGDSERPQCSWY